MTRKIPTALPAVLAAIILMNCGGSGTRDDEIARGKYLVENASMCIDCHTPRTPDGKLDQARWLQGAELGFAPAVPMPAWARYAPEIAGLPGMTVENGVRLLTEGIGPAGLPLRSPMPDYRLTQPDAQAVVAYLKTLPMSGNPVERAQ